MILVFLVDLNSYIKFNNLYYLNYKIIFLLSIFYFFLSFFIIYLSIFFIKINFYKEKIFPYECGFEPYNDTRNTFNIQFYLLGLFFLIFDLESLYLYPIVYSISTFSLFNIYILFDFFFELVLSYFFLFKYIKINEIL